MTKPGLNESAIKIDKKKLLCKSGGRVEGNSIEIRKIGKSFLFLLSKEFHSDIECFILYKPLNVTMKLAPPSSLFLNFCNAESPFFLRLEYSASSNFSKRNARNAFIHQKPLTKTVLVVVLVELKHRCFM